jgi:hypothetical protein
MPEGRVPDNGSQSFDARLLALEQRLKALEEWQSEVMEANPHLDTLLDPTPRGEASDE